MKTRLDTSAYELFGSGSATCKLEAYIGGYWKRIKGDETTTVDRNNGFAGLRSTVVQLYPKTKVRWVRAFYPGGRRTFEGTWEQLCSLPITTRILEKI